MDEDFFRRNRMQERMEILKETRELEKLKNLEEKNKNDLLSKLSESYSNIEKTEKIQTKDMLNIIETLAYIVCRI